MATKLELSLLLALAEGQKHGYAIYKQIQEDGYSDITVGRDLTVYRELPRLIKRGLVVKDGSSTKPTKYRLTALGRKWLRYEYGRIRKLEILFRERL
jgi:DNA-binding PadR family transcriptional regulator